MTLANKQQRERGNTAKIVRCVRIPPLTWRRGEGRSDGAVLGNHVDFRSGGGGGSGRGPVLNCRGLLKAAFVPVLVGAARRDAGTVEESRRASIYAHAAVPVLGVAFLDVGRHLVVRGIITLVIADVQLLHVYFLTAAAKKRRADLVRLTGRR